MATKISIASVIPEHQLILAESAKLLATVTDVSKYAIKGSSTVNYPTLAARSGQAIGLTASFTNNDANYGDEILALDQKLGDAFSVNIHVERQNVLNNLEDSTKETLRAMGLQADAAVYAALIAGLQTAGENVVATADMYADLVDIQKKMNDNKVPMSDRYFWCNTADYAKLLKTKDFVRFDATGNGAPITEGVVGMILGFKVVLSTAVSGDSVALHSKAVAWAIQGEPVMLESVDALATKIQYSISEVFGCKVTQSGAFAVRYGANPA